VRLRLRPTTDVACHEHDNQHQENEPAKTTPDYRATQVKAAPAEQQHQDYQQNYDIHRALLSDFGDSIATRLRTATISHDSLAWLFWIAHDRS
jgi:hypothetical protein